MRGSSHGPCGTTFSWFVFLLVPVVASADELPLYAEATAPPARVEHEELVNGDQRRRLNVYLGIDLVSHYIARGLVYLDEPSLQPWVELDLPLVQDRSGSGPDDVVSVFAGSWNNINVSGEDDGVARTGAAATLRNWYESDIYAGLRFRASENATVSLRYNFYTSPSDSFRDIHELDMRMSYNDAGHWQWLLSRQRVALYPALRVAKEVADRGGPDGWYFQPSLTPTWTWQPARLPMPVSLQVPLILGFGADGQYVTVDGDEKHFGYFQTGLGIAVDLGSLPRLPGGLTFVVAVDQIVLADDDLGFSGTGNETVVRVGLTHAFAAF